MAFKVQAFSRSERVEFAKQFHFISGGWQTALMIAQDKKCFYCDRGFTSNKKNTGTHVSRDHFFPRSKGYPDLIGNMVFACCDCNSKKSDNWPSDDLIQKAIDLYDSIGATLIAKAKRKKKCDDHD